MEFFTTREFCEQMGVSKTTALHWFKTGKVTANKIGGLWFIPKRKLYEKMEVVSKNDETKQPG